MTGQMSSRAVLLAAFALALAGCGSNLCDKSQQVDLTKKAGDCTNVLTGNLLGTGATCSMKTSPCSDADKQALTRALDCLDKVPACTAASRDVYFLSQKGCVDPLGSLTTACLDSVFGGVKPGEDGGSDAGTVDAGPQPISDGGNGIDLIGVADETDFAFAWSTRQPGDVAKWQLVLTDDAGVREERDLTPGSRIDYLLAMPGFTDRRFFLVGRSADGEIAIGQTDAGPSMMGDGGTMCMRHTDCPTNRVCDLGQCQLQTCQFGGPNTCPGGYQCFNPGRCERTTSDGGGFDAGRADSGIPDRPLPFISGELALSAGVPGFRGDIGLGGFPGRRPDIVGVDTARVISILEQEGQLVAHASRLRGADLADDTLTSSAVDTVGTRVKLTYNPESRLTFACYNVGRGVRVQRSSDFGRSWQTSAITIEPVDDGGLSATIADCDIAPWKNGGAMMVTVEDESLAVRTISSALSVSDPEYAFLPSPPDAGNLYTPMHPAIATLPSDSMVHVTFTGTRTLTNGVQDTEPFGVYRDGTLGAFIQPARLSGTSTGTAQDWTTVVIDPKTKRALSAYTSVDPGPGGNPISTVYTSLWNPMRRDWGSGSDLNVFVVSQNTTLLFPQKNPNDIWFAFSPALAALPNGKIFFSFVAGPRTNNIGDYRQYVVPFDFDLQSPLATSKGWYVRPVVKASELRVLDPRVASTAPQTPVSAFTADSQLSVYGAFIEGLGATGDTEGRAIFYSRP